MTKVYQNLHGPTDHMYPSYCRTLEEKEKSEQTCNQLCNNDGISKNEIDFALIARPYCKTKVGYQLRQTEPNKRLDCIS